MMNKEMSTALVSADANRMAKYKSLAVAFSYPADQFFTYFPKYLPQRNLLSAEYDRLFRRKEIRLQCTEYTITHEFQRAQALADIMGFYQAFGVQPANERPDSLACELEFMYYLICKQYRAQEEINSSMGKEKSLLCWQAQKKFFNLYIYPGAIRIAQTLISEGQKGFYVKMAKQLLQFLEAERKFLKVVR